MDSSSSSVYVRVRAKKRQPGYVAKRDSFDGSLHHKSEVGWVSESFPNKWFSSFPNLHAYRHEMRHPQQEVEEDEPAVVGADYVDE